MKKFKIRAWIAALLMLAVMGIFVSRLMNIQIVDAETYKKEIGNRTLYTQVIKATRGEIVDRGGEPMAGNRMGYDVIIDKATFPRGRENEVISNLIRLFESMGEEWTDNLPISREAPFEFLPDRGEDIARLKSFLEVHDYASAKDVLYWLDDRFGTSGYTPGEARKIVSVRYEMNRRGFAYNVPYTFATDIQISSVVQIKERRDLAGVDVIESTVRIHPEGDVMPHLIGMIGPIYDEELEELLQKGYARNDIVGKSGVERAFEDYLRGQDGKREIFTNGSGQVMEAVERIPPVPGNTIVLTIDKDMQRYAQEVLEKQIKNLQQTAPAGQGREADSGSVIMLECKTGKILACATYPSYDLNTYSQDYSKLLNDPLTPMVNRAVQGLYAPGSCFKPVVATAGLATGVIGEHSTFFCGQTFLLPNSPQRFTCLSHHGSLSVISALRVSCNIFFYNTGMRVGIETIDKTAQQYGLGEYTGIEIPDKQGQRSNPETKFRVEDGVEWYPGDVLQSSIGQLHHAYTPLQLANYAATIGNRGTRMKLTLVDEIRDYSQQTVIQPFVPEVADYVDAPPEAFETVVRGMVAASRTGTARAQFANYPIDVASKTGTPESIDLPNSTFICFAPADDPVVAIAVVIEKGWHGYTGAPVAKALFDRYFGYDVLAAETAPASSSAASSAPSSAGESGASGDASSR